MTRYGQNFVRDADKFVRITDDFPRAFRMILSNCNTYYFGCKDFSVRAVPSSPASLSRRLSKLATSQPQSGEDHPLRLLGLHTHPALGIARARGPTRWTGWPGRGCHRSPASIFCQHPRNDQAPRQGWRIPPASASSRARVHYMQQRSEAGLTAVPASTLSIGVSVLVRVRVGRLVSWTCLAQYESAMAEVKITLVNARLHFFSDI